MEPTNRSDPIVVSEPNVPNCYIEQPICYIEQWAESIYLAASGLTTFRTELNVPACSIELIELTAEYSVCINLYVSICYMYVQGGEDP